MKARLAKVLSRFRWQTRPAGALAPSAPIATPVQAAEAAAPAAAVPLSLTALLTRHVLRDGEVVLLALKPSLWFIVFQSIPAAAVLLLLALAVRLGSDHLPWRVQPVFIYEAAIFLLASRVMGAVIQWMARLYLLTNQRVVRLSGVFNLEIFDCPLRKVARTNLTCTLRERTCRLGSIEIFPREDIACDSEAQRDGAQKKHAERLPAAGVWQTIARAAEVHQRIIAAINKAKMCG